jgi:adenylate cyclase class 2
MPLEREIKIIGADFGALRKALQQAGADFQGRYFERNAVLDDESRSLKRKGILLRLRQADECALTLKIPAEEKDAGGFKDMREHETRIEDFDAALSIFNGLGLRPAFWYEKIREKWRMGGLSVDLDELPFGRFVELEGPAGEIREAVSGLGLSDLDATSENYHGLNEKYRKEQGLPQREGFTFRQGEAERILKNS